MHIIRRCAPRAVTVFALGALLAIALTACRGGAMPIVSPAPTAPAGEPVPCAPNMRVVPAVGTPTLGQTRAEALVRERLGTLGGPDRGQVGALLEARHVTVVASDRAGEAGQDRWLLTFAFTPASPVASLPHTPGTAWRAVAIADTLSGNVLSGCSGLLSIGATPIP